MTLYRNVVSSIFLAAGLGTLFAAPAFAEPGCNEMGGHNRHHEHNSKMMEQHHAKLHDALKLTPEQEPGWGRLMDSEKPRPMPGAGEKADWSKLSAPERAEKKLALSKARQEQMSEHAEALKAFYGTLTADQKKTFEEFHAGSRGGKRGKPAVRTPGVTKAPTN